MKNAVAIMDFGSSEIVTLVGELGVNNTLNILGKGRVSYAGFQNSEFLEPEHLKEVIRTSLSKAENMCDFKITEIYIGVPGEFTAVVPKTISLTFPSVKKVTELDVESIFRTGNSFEKETNYCLINKTVIYYELDEYQRVIDPIDMKTKVLTGNVSYILAKISFVNYIKEILSKIRVNIKGFISSVYAESLFLFEPDERDKYVILADIGYITTSVAIIQGNGLLSLNSFSLGGAYISSDLSQCLRIPFSEAEHLKNKIAICWLPSQQDNYFVYNGDSMLSYSARATNDIASDRMEMICDYIERCLETSGYEIPNFVPIRLTGSGVSSIKGIRNFMSQKLRRQILLTDTVNGHKIKPFESSREGLLNFVLCNSDSLNKIIIKL